MSTPPAERAPSFWRVGAELRAELRDRPKLPPGETSFSLARTHRLQRDTLRLMLELYARYGAVFTVRTLHRPLVVMIGPEANHFVTVSGADNFSWRKGMFGEYLSPLIGDGLITTDGEYHDRARLIMMPAFHRRRLDAAVEVMLEDTERAVADWRPGQVVDVYEWVRDLAMGIAMRAVLGLDAAEAGVGREAAALFERVLAYTNAEVWATLLRGPGTPWARMQRARRDLDRIIYAEIERRRGAGAGGGPGATGNGAVRAAGAAGAPGEPGEPGEDILSMLIEAGGKSAGARFTDTELRDQLMHMLFGGHDTSSSTVAFLLYELARHPAVLARVLAEQDAVLGGRAPTAELLMNELPVLRMAMEETLRLYPPVWFGPRMAIREFEFGGHRIPAGTHIMHSSWVTHHLPTVFPDPEAFVPERFAPEARGSIPRGGYLPFGGGARICIGKRFGQLMVQAVVTTLLQRFRLELQAGYELRLEKLPTLSPGNGMPMVVRERRTLAPAPRVRAVADARRDPPSRPERRPRREVSVAQARALALALPGAVEQRHHGRPSFRVGGKIFATLWDEGHMNVMLDPDGIRTAVQAEPATCTELRWGTRLAAVQVSLARVDAGLLSDLLTDAWEQRAPARLRR